MNEDKEIIKLKRKDLLEILNVKNTALKQIIRKKQLETRLKEKGYYLIKTEKTGRNTIYYAYKCDPILFINPNYNKIDNFKVDYDKRNNKGIYYIYDGFNIYIGSTINFRKRFLDHWNGGNFMQHTYDLLHNKNGEFNIIHDMTNINDLELIRMVENEYIQYFKEYTDFNVINHVNEAVWKGKNYKQKYKNIKIKIEDYDNALKVLEENEIEI